MKEPDVMLRTALELHRAGRLDEAEMLYRRVLESAPQSGDAWKLLGMIAHQRGQHQQAIEYLTHGIDLLGRRDAGALSNLGEVYRTVGRFAEARQCFLEALRLDASLPEAWNNFGTLQKSTGDEQGALNAFQQALHLRPNYAEAWNNLGTLMHQLGRFDEGEQCLLRAANDPRFRGTVLVNLAQLKRSQNRLDDAARYAEQAIIDRPERVEGHAVLGLVRLAQRRHDKAEQSLRRALELRPDLPEVLNNLALVYHTRGDRDAALVHYRRALDIQPDDPETLNNLGALLNETGCAQEAIECFERALQQRPDFAEAHNNLGLVYLHQLADVPRADKQLQTAIRLKPDYAEAHNHLGVVRAGQGRASEALELYERAIRLQPDNVETYNNLGNLLLAMGDTAGAGEQHAIAMRLRPDSSAAESNWLMGHSYDGRVTPEELLARHVAYGDRLAARVISSMPPEVPWQPEWPNSRDPARAMRVGFVSADMGQHPIGLILLPLLEQLRGSDWQVICYSNRRCYDPIEQRLMQAASQWRDMVGATDTALVKQIRDDRIDVLFDMSGLTAGHRMGAFAMRGAPVQVTWAGYQATTGLKTMDWLLSDQYMVPAGSEHYFREQVMRLPEAAWCCAIDTVGAGIVPAVRRADRPLTLASFNNPAKLGPAVIKLWSRILRALPEAVLVLKYRGFDDPGVAGRFRRLFTTEGVAESRLEFRGRTDFPAMLREYHDVDIALDPFPFSGGITTLAALWMGVPVVTLPGVPLASRQSLSILANSGLAEELVAKDEDQYVSMVATLAGNRAQLDARRGELRQHVERSAFMDAARFAPAWKGAVRQMWTAWCERS